MKSDTKPTSALQIPTSMAQWMELFVDLIFVAAMLVFSSSVDGLHSGVAKVWVEVSFAMVWWIWLCSTLLLDRFRLRDNLARFVLLAQMFLIVLYSIEAKSGINHDHKMMVAEFGGLLLTVALLWALVLREPGDRTIYVKRMVVLNLVGACLFFLAAPLKDTFSYPLCAAGLLIVLVPTVIPSLVAKEWPPFNREHLVERLGTFSLIVMGETFIDIALSISTRHVGSKDVIVLLFQFLFVFSLWAAYFEDIPHAGLQKARASLWLFFHFTLQFSIVLIGMGVAAIVNAPYGEHLPDQDSVEIFGMMALFYLSLAVLDWCSDRKPLKNLILLRLAGSVLTLAIALLGVTVPSLKLDELVLAATVVAMVSAFIAPILIRKTSAPESEPALSSLHSV